MPPCLIPRCGCSGASWQLTESIGRHRAVHQSPPEYALAIDPNFKSALADNIILTESKIALKNNAAVSVSYNELFEKNSLDELKVEVSSKPGDEQKKYAFC